MNNNSTAWKLWKKLGYSALGRWVFARIVCFNAPYFSSIKPKLLTLESNVCIAAITQSRSIQNHIKSIHAIALCNLAELSAGLMTDVTIPTGMRWIPKKMSVNYLQKAQGTITATAAPRAAFYETNEGYEAIVDVILMDKNNNKVFSAEIQMWISKKN